MVFEEPAKKIDLETGGVFKMTPEELRKSEERQKRAENLSQQKGEDFVFQEKKPIFDAEKLKKELDKKTIADTIARKQDELIKLNEKNNDPKTTEVQKGMYATRAETLIREIQELTEKSQ